MATPGSMVPSCMAASQLLLPRWEHSHSLKDNYIMLPIIVHWACLHQEVNANMLICSQCIHSLASFSLLARHIQQQAMLTNPIPSDACISHCGRTQGLLSIRDRRETSRMLPPLKGHEKHQPDRPESLEKVTVTRTDAYNLHAGQSRCKQ